MVLPGVDCDIYRENYLGFLQNPLRESPLFSRTLFERNVFDTVYSTGKCQLKLQKILVRSIWNKNRKSSLKYLYLDKIYSEVFKVSVTRFSLVYRVSSMCVCVCMYACVYTWVWLWVNRVCVYVYICVSILGPRHICGESLIQPCLNNTQMPDKSGSMT